MRENAPTPATPQNTSTKDGEDSTMAKTKTELYDELVDIETSLENHPLTSGKIGKSTLLQSFSLWKLSHRKSKVEAAIEKLNRKEARQR